MKLTEVLDLDKKTIISIVGAGGKTSLMLQLAHELSGKGRVLLTTTTKIYVPKEEAYDYLVIGEEEFEKSFKESTRGIWVYGKGINEDNKLTAIDEEKLKFLTKDFHYILIEGDGSKGKPLKGWNSDEPIVASSTTCTIGVLSGGALGLNINEENIHRVNGFLGKQNGTVDEKDLIEVIFNSKGMFKNARGKKVLYINQLDSEEDYERNRQLIDEIIKENEGRTLLNKVIIGSLNMEKYSLIDLGGAYD